jgi:pyrimidine-nucleoside phosphorylase
MNIKDIINKKNSNSNLTKEEIDYVVTSYVNNDITDEEMTPFLQAIVNIGMNYEETSNLTKSMLQGSVNIDLSDIDGVKIDKHSTGGVGDKVTLILLPIVTSIGVKVAKMSGRGLGFTGGTIDKLESIPGLKVSLKEKDFIKQVKDINLAICEQTNTLVPADKKIYNLRNLTNTVSSIPLIASSIMSKKIASGNDKIIIDVKVGNGALMDNLMDAKTLSEYMIKIGTSFDKEVICVLTNMDEPLGYAIGNKLEVIEAYEFLKGNMEPKLKELVFLLATIMVNLSLGIDTDEAYKLVENSIISGKALIKFNEMVEYQGGTLDLENNAKMFSIRSNETGFINSINALKLGELARSIGAGKLTKDDTIDHNVGFVLNKKVGDFVFKGEELVKCYISDKDIVLKDITDAFSISLQKEETNPLIYDIIR